MTDRLQPTQAHMVDASTLIEDAISDAKSGSHTHRLQEDAYDLSHANASELTKLKDSLDTYDQNVAKGAPGPFVTFGKNDSGHLEIVAVTPSSVAGELTWVEATATDEGKKNQSAAALAAAEGAKDIGNNYSSPYPSADGRKTPPSSVEHIVKS
jgi:hypothetical protein